MCLNKPEPEYILNSFSPSDINKFILLVYSFLNSQNSINYRNVSKFIPYSNYSFLKRKLYMKAF